MKTFLASCFLSATSLAVCSAAEFNLGGHAFTIPEGFTIELVAHSPLVDRPIEADFDEQGRLYVTDSSGSNDKIEKQLAEKPHRVVRLEDTDGDGKFDKTVTFADKLSFPEGAMWLDGSLYVSVPPIIWKLTDTDDDGVADKREEWFNGGTVTGCANDLHGPYAGPDGWIYWNKGAFAKQSHDRPGQMPLVTRASHTFRSRPDGSGLESVMTGGMDNPVGLAFTPEGDRFFTCTFILHPAGGQRDALVHEIYGGVYGKPHDVLDEHPQTGDLMPVTTHLGPAAPCGLMRYESNVMGADYRDNMFVCQFNLHRVSRHVLVRDGSTYKTKDSNFVTVTDTDFHPTDVLEDADGSILVVDTGGWYKLCCPTSQLAKPDVLGAIYRIRKTGMKQPADARGAKINWAGQSPSALATLLSDERPAVRRKASDQIAKTIIAKDAMPNLRKNARTPEARIEAIWTLAKLGSRGQAVIEGLLPYLSDENVAVRLAAANAVSVTSTPSLGSTLRAAFINMLAKGSVPEQRIAAEVLGRLKAADAILPILNAATSRIDRVLEHSLAFALIEIGDAKAIRAAMADTKGEARKVALIALSQIKGGLEPSDIAPLLTDSGDLRKTAEWIAIKHPEWGAAFADIFRERIMKNSAEAKSLEALLGRMASSADIQKLLRDLAGDSDSERSTAALRVMARAAGKKPPEGWADAVAKAVRSNNPEVARQAIESARTINSGKDSDLEQALIDAATHPRNSDAIRLAAYRSRSGKSILPQEIFKLAITNLNPNTPLSLRSDAVTILARGTLNEDQYLELADAFALAGPMELTRLFDAYETYYTEAAGLRVVEALRKSSVVPSLPPELIAQKLSKFPVTVRKAAEALPRASEDATVQRHQLEELAASFKGLGDIRRGQAIFNSQKTACITCHSMGYLGGKVGPDLTSIGQVRTEIDLLEAIIYPNASFVRSYESVFVKTNDGESYTGILRGDSDEGILLVTGPNIEERIPRGKIELMQPSSVSLMPAGLETQLTREELADLVAFLKGTKWGAN